MKPRTETTDIINIVKNKVFIPTTPISIYRRSTDVESYDYATKIVKSLRRQGYTNVFVNGIVNEIIVGGSPEENNKLLKQIRYEWTGDGKQFDITIPANQ